MSFISKVAAATRARAKNPGMALDESPGPFFHRLIPDQGPGHRPTLCEYLDSASLCSITTVALSGRCVAEPENRFIPAEYAETGAEDSVDD